MGKRFAVVALSLAALVLGACGGDNEPSSSGSPSTGGTSSVAVTLQEWAVIPASASTAAGKVTFNVTNSGKKHEHEFVVFKTDLDAGSLPAKADGSVNEDAAGLTNLGEIEELGLGKTESKTFDLTAGKYVLICNIVEDPPMEDMGGIKAHYKLGMRVAFTVT
jgi:uncharacterized cupredoxin-like copper-binding protein